MPGKPVRDGLFEADSETGAARLLASQCGECARYVFPARSCCPYCGSGETKLTRLGARGTVDACTLVRQAPPGYQGPVPYALAVVHLPEGVAVITAIPTDHVLPAGTAVECRYWVVGHDDNGTPLVSYCFAPVEAPEEGPVNS